MKCTLQPQAGFKWCSIMFAVSEAVPAEPGTSFSVLIFIKTAIDFNCSVNRHAQTLLSASPPVLCSPSLCINRFLSRLSQSPRPFVCFYCYSLTTMLRSHTLQNVLTAATAGVLAKDAYRLSLRRPGESRGEKHSDKKKK